MLSFLFFEKIFNYLWKSFAKLFQKFREMIENLAKISRKSTIFCKRKGDMSDLRIFIFLKFVRFGDNFGLLFIFAMSVLPNLYFKNKDDLLHVRGNMRVCLLLFIHKHNQRCCFYLS